MNEPQKPSAETPPDGEDRKPRQPERLWHYRVRFRPQGREFTAESRIADLAHGELVMVRTDHGPEPAVIAGRAASFTGPDMERRATSVIKRRATREEEEKYARLPILEKEAYDICQEQIRDLRLSMHLVRVERFFNGSKIIFYFTAESRVDFRELVKKLVQEFRTRVEMRQIGVRHETQMTGGIGACGRELCCTTFLRKFESVSIKMAKAQDLPLNPAKISGVCNRLLCCLTYEYDNYRIMKQGMPRVGRLVRLDDTVYRVIRLIPLSGEVLVLSPEGEERLLKEDEWRAAEPVQRKPQKSHGKRRQGGGKNRPRGRQKKKKQD
ncbi:stage 0 sporulation family protein [Thermodesulfobacteriota bacterium B35]